jgi:hypothetical protein
MFVSPIVYRLVLDTKEANCITGLVCWLGNSSFRVDVFASTEATKIATG